jgi:hypothetical protein
MESYQSDVKVLNFYETTKRPTLKIEGGAPPEGVEFWWFEDDVLLVWV